MKVPLEITYFLFEIFFSIMMSFGNIRKDRFKSQLIYILCILSNKIKESINFEKRFLFLNCYEFYKSSCRVNGLSFISSTCIALVFISFHFISSTCILSSRKQTFNKDETILQNKYKFLCSFEYLRNCTWYEKQLN